MLRGLGAGLRGQNHILLLEPWPDSRAPFEVACFPYAQHFLTTSYPRATTIHDSKGLADAVRGLGEDGRAATGP